MVALFCLVLGASSAPIADIDADDIAKIQFIQQRLDEGTRNARIWFWTWETVYALGAVGQVAVAFAIQNDPETRVNLLVGGASSLIGAVALIIPPFVAAFSADRLRDLPERTPEQREQKRLAAEMLMKDTAENAAFGRSWFIHAGGAAVSVAGGLVLWLGFHYLVDGIVNTVASLAVAQAQIWTQPMRSVRDYQEYQDRFVLQPQPASTTAKLEVHSGVFPGGLSVYGSF